MNTNTNNIYRDVTMDNISEKNVGETVRIAGWIENIRDHGGVSFIDLRDMYGVMQVVMRDTSLLEGLNKEELNTETKKHTIQRFQQEQLN